MADRFLFANDVAIVGVRVLMEAGIHPMPTFQNLNKHIPSWKFVIPTRPVLRINSWKLWTELIAQVMDMDEDRRVEVLMWYEKYCWRVVQATTSRKPTTGAEFCLYHAVKRINEKYSLTTDGANEYDQIMRAQEMVEDGN